MVHKAPTHEISNLRVFSVDAPAARPLESRHKTEPALDTTPPRRDVGRPRLYSDTAIFAAVDDVLRADGYSDLTLEAIANRVGCTRQALVRRFGSKDALLLAFLDALVAQVEAEFSHLSRTADSPLDALYARFVLPPESRMDMSANPRAQASVMAFLLTASDDPEFAVRIAALNRMNIQAIAWLLEAAVERHELEPVDTRLVGHILYNLWAGEIVGWCIDPSTDMAAKLRQGFDIVIGPHRPRSS